jgi:hypothetical protein
LHTQFLSQEVYMRSLTDDTDASTYFADLPQTLRCRFWVKSCGRSPAVSDERGWDGRANCQMHLIVP